MPKRNSASPLSPQGFDQRHGIRANRLNGLQRGVIAVQRVLSVTGRNDDESNPSEPPLGTASLRRIRQDEIGLRRTIEITIA